MSSFSEQDPASKQDLRQLQIIVGALVAGCVLFLVLVLVAGDRLGLEGFAAEGQFVFTYVAVAFTVADLAARMIVPAMMVARGRKRIAGSAAGDEEVRRELWVLFKTTTIIAAAFVKGVAFLMTIAYLLERADLSLILAIVLILGLATHFPTRSGVARWMGAQLRRIEEERQLGR
ncbi:MAG: hypothetical protein ACYTG0_26290 [Planctomycetota bacterium]